MATTRNPWPVLLVTVLGFFMIMLDTTIVYVATPSMLSSLHASLDEVLWVFNGYLLTYAVLLITAGRLGDLFGPRQMFALGLIVFTAASAACGLSHDGTQLIAARVVQGVGGALIAPQTLTVLMAIFPPERRGAAFGITGAVIGISTVAGPTLGGWIVTNLDWRWIFFLNVPVGILALVGTFAVIPDVRPGRKHRLDLVGVALSSVALFAIIYGLIEGERYDWGTITGWLTIPMVLGAGVAFILAFFLWEWRQREPLVPLGLFRNRNFSLMNWTSAAMAFALQGIFIVVPIYMQSVLGMTALQSGLTVAPMSIVAAILAPFVGRASDRFGGKYLLMAGLAIFGLGAALVVAAATSTSTQATFIVPYIVAGIGLGLVFSPMTTVAMQQIAPAMAGAASGVLNTTRQLGAALGGAVIGAVLQNQLASAFHRQAVSASAQLPPAFRHPFVDGFTQAAKAGLQVGRGQTGASLPSGLPAQVAARVSELIHEVFVNGYIEAMRPTIAVSVAVLLIASATCAFVINRRSAATRTAAAEVAVA